MFAAADVIYALSYVDVGQDGPLVFEAPPGLQGMFLDVWQRPITGPTSDGNLPGFIVWAPSGA